MHQVTADKLCMGQGNLPLRVTGLSAPGRESNRILRKGKYPVVGDGNPVGIAPKIFNGISKTVKGLLNVGAPVFFIKLIFPFFPVKGIAQLLTGRGKGKGTAFVKGRKKRHIFALELIPQDCHRNKKFTGRFTDFLISGKAAAGNNAVHMHMVIQLLVPGMQDLNDTGCCAEPLLICG